MSTDSEQSLNEVAFEDRKFLKLKVERKNKGEINPLKQTYFFK